MAEVTVSSKYQIVIPRAVREKLKIKPGQKIGFLVEEANAVLVPMRPLREFQKSLRGITAPPFEREPDRDPEGRVRYATILAKAKRRRAS